jgi:hypothetical protein
MNNFKSMELNGTKKSKGSREIVLSLTWKRLKRILKAIHNNTKK